MSLSPLAGAPSSAAPRPLCLPLRGPSLWSLVGRRSGLADARSSGVTFGVQGTAPCARMQRHRPSFCGIRHSSSPLDMFDATCINVGTLSRLPESEGNPNTKYEKQTESCGRGTPDCHGDLRLVAPCRFHLFSPNSVRRGPVLQRLRPRASTFVGFSGATHARSCTELGPPRGQMGTHFHWIPQGRSQRP